MGGGGLGNATRGRCYAAAAGAHLPHHTPAFPATTRRCTNQEPCVSNEAPPHPCVTPWAATPPDTSGPGRPSCPPHAPPPPPSSSTTCSSVRHSVREVSRQAGPCPCPCPCPGSPGPSILPILPPEPLARSPGAVINICFTVLISIFFSVRWWNVRFLIVPSGLKFSYIHIHTYICMIHTKPHTHTQTHTHTHTHRERERERERERSVPG